MAGFGEGSSGDVEPTIAGEELVGVFMVAEEVDQALELLRVLGPDVGSLAHQMLRVTVTQKVPFVYNLNYFILAVSLAGF